jgi:hypothetical protein
MVIVKENNKLNIRILKDIILLILIIFLKIDANVQSLVKSAQPNSIKLGK